MSINDQVLLEVSPNLVCERRERIVSIMDGLMDDSDIDKYYAQHVVSCCYLVAWLL